MADLALLLNIVLLLGAMALFEATLTLPGIAGIVLTIGMAVDANVLIFERIREELRPGKTPRAAIDAGYTKAFLTIFDSNVTTLIAAVFLFQFGTGAGQGVRRDADDRHHRQHVHGRLCHPDHLRLLHLEPEDREAEHLVPGSEKKTRLWRTRGYTMFEFIRPDTNFDFVSKMKAAVIAVGRVHPDRHRLDHLPRGPQPRRRLRRRRRHADQVPEGGHHGQSPLGP